MELTLENLRKCMSKEIQDDKKYLKFLENKKLNEKLCKIVNNIAMRENEFFAFIQNDWEVALKTLNNPSEKIIAVEFKKIIQQRCFVVMAKELFVMLEIVPVENNVFTQDVFVTGTVLQQYQSLLKLAKEKKSPELPWYDAKNRILDAIIEGKFVKLMAIFLNPFDQTTIDNINAVKSLIIHTQFWQGTNNELPKGITLLSRLVGGENFKNLAYELQWNAIEKITKNSNFNENCPQERTKDLEILQKAIQNSDSLKDSLIIIQKSIDNDQKSQETYLLRIKIIKEILGSKVLEKQSDRRSTSVVKQLNNLFVGENTSVSALWEQIVAIASKALESASKSIFNTELWLKSIAGRLCGAIKEALNKNGLQVLEQLLKDCTPIKIIKFSEFSDNNALVDIPSMDNDSEDEENKILDQYLNSKNLDSSQISISTASDEQDSKQDCDEQSIYIARNTIIQKILNCKRFWEAQGKGMFGGTKTPKGIESLQKIFMDVLFLSWVPKDKSDYIDKTIEKQLEEKTTYFGVQKERSKATQEFYDATQVKGQEGVNILEIFYNDVVLAWLIKNPEQKKGNQILQMDFINGEFDEQNKNKLSNSFFFNQSGNKNSSGGGSNIVISPNNLKTSNSNQDKQSINIKSSSPKGKNFHISESFDSKGLVKKDEMVLKGQYEDGSGSEDDNIFGEGYTPLKKFTPNKKDMN